MDLSKLQNKLEELGVEQNIIDEVLIGAKDETKQSIPKLDNDALAIMREYETDWRKKAIIAAEIVKRGLDT